MRSRSISEGNLNPTVNSHFRSTEAFQCHVHVNHNRNEAASTNGSQKHVSLEIRGARVIQLNEQNEKAAIF